MNSFRTITAVVLPILVLLFLVPATASFASPAIEQNDAAKAVNAFAIDFYKQVRGGQGNLFFSPYSISMALGMAYAGARGNTAAQMAKTMHLGLDQPSSNKALGALDTQILAAGRKKGVELKVANALWADKSCPLLKEYLEVIRTGYQGGIRQLDFAQNPEPARKTINSWVEEQTKDKIKDLLAPGAVDTTTRLVLTNAIYFMGLWVSQFNKEFTKELPFTLPDGNEVQVPMMHRTEYFSYMDETDLQVLEMEYKGVELSMVVLLPSKEKGLEDLEESVTLDRLDQWIGEHRRRGERKVEVFLPRFKMTSDFLLRTVLTNMGMTDAFSLGSADFSGMTGNMDFFIGEGFHKAFVEVNEHGTEAAAATGFKFDLKGTARVTPPPIPIFRADHPFLFLIRHKPTNCILFFGRVTNPSN
jgi:serpin B